MANNDGIREPHLIYGIRAITSGYVFPKGRKAKKEKKADKEKRGPFKETGEEDTTESDEKDSGGIDIRV